MDDIVKLLRDVFAETKERSSNKFLSSILISVCLFNHNNIIDLLWYGYLGASYTKYYLNQILFTSNTFYGTVFGFAWALFSARLFLILEQFKYSRIDKKAMDAWHDTELEKAEKAFQVAAKKSGAKSLESANQKIEQLKNDYEFMTKEASIQQTQLTNTIDELSGRIRIFEKDAQILNDNFGRASTEATRLKAENARLSNEISILEDRITSRKMAENELTAQIFSALDNEDNSILATGKKTNTENIVSIIESHHKKLAQLEHPKPQRVSKFQTS